eukprot:SAG25_NODE_9782_length_358_cov_0.783784_1_plen_99_part_01
MACVVDRGEGGAYHPHRADAAELRVDLFWRGGTASLGVAQHRLLGEEAKEAEGPHHDDCQLAQDSIGGAGAAGAALARLAAWAQRGSGRYEYAPPAAGA